MQINMRHKMKLLIHGSKVDLFLERQFGSKLFSAQFNIS